MYPLKLKRIHQAIEKEDGFRIFIESFWPKDLAKDTQTFDLWLKDIAPSEALLEWFEHHPRRWKEFNSRYGKELMTKYTLLNLILKEIQHQPVTLIHCAQNLKRHHAIALCLQLQFQFLKQIN